MVRSSRLVTALLLVCAPNVFGQSLGEVARRHEAEKKQKKTSPGKTFTESDLARFGGDGQAQPPPPPDATSSVREDPSNATEPGMGEKEWRALAANHRGAVRKSEQQLAAVQAFVDRINYGLAGLPVLAHDMYGNVEARKQKALADLARAQAILADTRRDQHAFEQEARRKRIPPGWLRE